MEEEHTRIIFGCRKMTEVIRNQCTPTRPTNCFYALYKVDEIRTCPDMRTIFNNRTNPAFIQTSITVALVSSFDAFIKFPDFFVQAFKIVVDS